MKELAFINFKLDDTRYAACNVERIVSIELYEDMEDNKYCMKISSIYEGSRQRFVGSKTYNKEKYNGFDDFMKKKTLQLKEVGINIDKLILTL